MAELLTRRRADWSPYERDMLLRYHNNGMTHYQIAKELKRSTTAIRMQLENILPQNPIQLYTPPNTIPVEPPKIIQDDFTTQATVMYQKCMKEGMSIEEATNYLLNNRPVSTIPTISTISTISTPIKNDCFIA